MEGEKERARAQILRERSAKCDKGEREIRICRVSERRARKKKRKERSIDTTLIPIATKPKKKGVDLIMLRIRQNPIIKMNSDLLVAKGTVFEDNDVARQFSASLISMIMETTTAKNI